MLTPSGRFELNTKICISFTNYHEELWQPAWGVRTAIIGLQGFFSLKGQAAVGVASLEAPASERKRLAQLSRQWVCPHCKVTNLECLPDPQPLASSSREVGASASLPEADATSPDLSTESPSEPASGLPPDPEPREEAQAPSPPGTTSLPSIQLQSNPSNPVHLAHQMTHRTVIAGNNTNLEDRQTVVQPVAPAQIISAGESNVSSSPRPPILLDAAIFVLLVLLGALLCRRLL